MNEIPLANLPRWSPWPSRLLALESWNPTSRTVDKVEQEYNQGKYARLLANYLQDDQRWTPEDVESDNYGLEPSHQCCISLENTLCEVTLAEARNRYYEMLCKALRPYCDSCRTVVELGCGYGYNLWMLRNHLDFAYFLGGDYAANAVKLAELLYRDLPNLRVHVFNYYDPASYRFLAEAQAPLVVFTSHSLEQIPCSQRVIEALAHYRDRIHKVLHFEPAYQLYDDSLLGQLRRRYTQINNYNVDLFGQLRSSSNIYLEETEANVLGLNALNPSSILRWSFRKAA